MDSQARARSPSWSTTMMVRRPVSTRPRRRSVARARATDSREAPINPASSCCESVTGASAGSGLAGAELEQERREPAGHVVRAELRPSTVRLAQPFDQRPCQLERGTGMPCEELAKQVGGEGERGERLEDDGARQPRRVVDRRELPDEIARPADAEQ